MFDHLHIRQRFRAKLWIRRLADRQSSFCIDAFALYAAVEMRGASVNAESDVSARFVKFDDAAAAFRVAPNASERTVRCQLKLLSFWPVFSRWRMLPSSRAPEATILLANQPLAKSTRSRRSAGSC